MRTYHVKNISSDAQIDKQLTNYRRKNNFIKSVVENYSSTIQNRELLTKYLKKRSSYVNNVDDISHTNTSYMG